MKTHPLNHRQIKGEKRDMCWLLTASYIIQFNENSPTKPQTYIQEERKEICGGYLQPHTQNAQMKTHQLNHTQIGGEKR